MTKNLRRHAVPCAAVFLLTFTAAGTASASPQHGNIPEVPTTTVPAEESRLPLPSPSDVGLEDLVLPPVPEEMATLASGLSERFAEDDQFASVEVTLERDEVIVHWHGELSAELQQELAKSPLVPTTIEQTEFSPGELRDVADTVFANPNVAGVSVLPDASGLEVLVTPETAETIEVNELQADLESATGVPIEVNDDAPAPAASSRLNDYDYLLGGARLRNFDIGTGCTSGFAVRRDSDNNEGIMFAAHCGGLGNRVGIVSENRGVIWGLIASRNTYNDTAIIDTPFSNTFMWNGAYTTSTYSAINGQAAPFINQEICYSGSYSGSICGNIVNASATTWSVGGDLTNIHGFRTEQAQGSPAAGNGDSGGPGYSIVVNGSTVQRMAVGIISAIPINSGTNCRGVPGEAGDTGRKCSTTIYAGSVVSASTISGWSVPTT